MALCDAPVVTKLRMASGMLHFETMEGMDQNFNQEVKDQPPCSSIPVDHPSLEYEQCLIGLPQNMYKVDCYLACPFLPVQVGLTKRLNTKEWNYQRVVCSSLLGNDD
ncbi:hypothetical protein Q3G72_014601 [Acer saccharum]|nr:hypothetical protein Q3G72_014601 [Acer saccharum]